MADSCYCLPEDPAAVFSTCPYTPRARRRKGETPGTLLPGEQVAAVEHMEIAAITIIVGRSGREATQRRNRVHSGAITLQLVAGGRFVIRYVEITEEGGGGALLR